MKKKLIIDFSNELNIKFQLEKDVIIHDIFFNTSGRKIAIDFKFDGEFYNFTLNNKFINEKNIGENTFTFIYSNTTINNKNNTNSTINNENNTNSTINNENNTNSTINDKNNINNNINDNNQSSDNETYQISKFKGFSKVKIKNNQVKNINGFYVILNQKINKELIVLIAKNIDDFKFRTLRQLTNVFSINSKFKIEGKFNPLLLPIEYIEIALEGVNFSKYYFNLDYNFNNIDNKQDIANKSVIDNNFDNDTKIAIDNEFNIDKKIDIDNNLDNDDKSNSDINKDTASLFDNIIYSKNFKVGGTLDIPVDIENGTYTTYIYYKIKGIDDKIKSRFAKTRFLDRIKFKDLIFEYNDNSIFVSPYLTISGYNNSFNIENISNNILNEFKNVKSLKVDKKRDIWIIGEKPYKAQENGKIFFEYMRKNHPDREVYYIIDYNSKDYEKIKDLGNIIDFQSPKHFEMILKASYIFSTHLPENIYPLNNKSFKNLVKGKKIFLQHGVLGVRNLRSGYLNQKSIFDTDIFIVSGQREKQIVTEELEFHPKQVKITGIPRFDELFSGNVKTKNQIIIIPTWRIYLQALEHFLDSQYFYRFKSLLSNEKLLNFAIENDIKIIFGLHPNMQQYTQFFNEFLDDFEKKFKKKYKSILKKDFKFPIELFYQGDLILQDLIKESALLVTDYSSVANDFSFLYKPVLYYMFDQNKFLTNTGSHLDLERELPGAIFSIEYELVDEIIKIAKNSFKMDEKYKNRVKNIITYRDTDNSKRIYEEVVNFNFKESLIDKIKKSEFYRRGFKKFRRSKFYFPLMKIYYNFFKLLPLKPWYVFESGLGKQYSDSPRYLYEELIKHKDIEAIWIYNKFSFLHTQNTKVVKRFSPEYFYYLARSKYWINNQNFPSYIKKRRNTKFLQTWHGTPLKKMLNDLDKIYGRSEGYLDRINGAVKQWTYLLSQSPYTTKSFRSAFNFKKEIIEEGYPRNDIFFNGQEQEIAIRKIKNQYSINPNGRKIILYAPTFRDNLKEGKKFYEDIQINYDDFFDKFKDDYILLIRSHSVIKSNIKLDDDKFNNSIINVSNYSDIQEIYQITDILITDYSSVFFDFVNSKKPIIFYPYDKEEYIDNIRGLYLNYDEIVPGPIVKNQKELFYALENIEQIKKQYKEKINNFKKVYAPMDDGKSSQRIVKKYLLD